MPTIREEDTLTCVQCNRALVIGQEYQVVQEENYCLDCHSDHTFCCDDCGDMHHIDGRFYVDRPTRNICENCYDNHYFSCGECGDYFHNDHYGSDGMCNACYRDMNDDSDLDSDDVETGRLRNSPDIASVALIGKEPGEIIKSKRYFGIELETLFKNSNSLAKLAEIIHPTWGVTGDGSIRESKDSLGEREIISPIMRGKKGEDEINKLCKEAYNIGFFVNKSCGYHLHLDAREFKRNPENDKQEVHPHASTRALYRVKIEYAPNQYDYQMYERIQDIPRDKGGNLYPYEVIASEEDLVIVNRGPEFYRLRNLWYVYLAFDDIFRGMQPPSRRHNQFCISTSSLYSLDSIRDLDDYSELERLWYKVDRRRRIADQIALTEERKRGKDSSRYTGFNLEPLLRYNSSNIEFRYHSPTLNAEKILRWTDIHQTIVDFVAKNPIDEQYINAIVAGETHLIRKAEAMCQYFKIRKDTKEYILQRLHKFNKINSANVEDEEVEESELGRPMHQPPEMRMRAQAPEPRNTRPPTDREFQDIREMLLNNSFQYQVQINPYVLPDDIETSGRSEPQPTTATEAVLTEANVRSAIRNLNNNN